MEIRGRNDKALTAGAFRTELAKVIDEAQGRGETSVEVNSGQLHRRIGGYPGSSHRMPMCCEVMYKEMKEGDRILDKPPKGKGASLTISYSLPRPAPPLP